ncbi:hypothetical protein AB0D45_00100 [Streptomyces sp. NPDC048352]|uniref:hypothetical protein n=1 Tax=Streptomyces TaxID=1883 RepID=UPI00340AE28C
MGTGVRPGALRTVGDAEGASTRSSPSPDGRLITIAVRLAGEEYTEALSAGEEFAALAVDHILEG